MNLKPERTACSTYTFGNNALISVLPNFFDSKRIMNRSLHSWDDNVRKEMMCARDLERVLNSVMAESETPFPRSDTHPRSPFTMTTNGVTQ